MGIGCTGWNLGTAKSLREVTELVMPAVPVFIVSMSHLVVADISGALVYSTETGRGPLNLGDFRVQFLAIGEWYGLIWCRKELGLFSMPVEMA